MTQNVYVCFTCLRDSDLLPLHYQALRQAVPGVRVYYVFSLEERNDASVPQGATKVLTDFPRNGNLLGLDCHLGMLRTMQAISERHGNANVIKIDSDVCFRSDYFLTTLGQEHDMVGVAPALEYYCKGTCYGMTHDLITKVIHYLTHGYRDLSGRLEDSTISMVAAIVSDAGKVLIHNCMEEGGTEALYSIFHKQHMETPALLRQVRGFFDCGDPLFTHDYPDAVTAKVKAMQFILQHS